MSGFVLLIILFLLLMWLFSLFYSKRSGGSRRVSGADSYVLMRGGDYDWDIVGESYYQETLEELVGGKGEEGAFLEVGAALMLEDDNSFDKNAVAVYVGEFKVGYLSRKDAVMFRRRLGAQKISAKCIGCSAVIVGGWRDSDGEGHFGVRLSATPDLAVQVVS